MEKNLTLTKQYIGKCRAGDCYRYSISDGEETISFFENWSNIGRGLKGLISLGAPPHILAKANIVDEHNQQLSWREFSNAVPVKSVIDAVTELTGKRINDEQKYQLLSENFRGENFRERRVDTARLADLVMEDRFSKISAEELSIFILASYHGEIGFDIFDKESREKVISDYFDNELAKPYVEKCGLRAAIQYLGLESQKQCLFGSLSPEELSMFVRKFGPRKGEFFLEHFERARLKEYLVLNKEKDGVDGICVVLKDYDGKENAYVYTPNNDEKMDMKDFIGEPIVKQYNAEVQKQLEEYDRLFALGKLQECDKTLTVKHRYLLTPHTEWELQMRISQLGVRKKYPAPVGDLKKQIVEDIITCGNTTQTEAGESIKPKVDEIVLVEPENKLSQDIGEYVRWLEINKALKYNNNTELCDKTIQMMSSNLQTMKASEITEHLIKMSNVIRDHYDEPGSCDKVLNTMSELKIPESQTVEFFQSFVDDCAKSYNTQLNKKLSDVTPVPQFDIGGPDQQLKYILEYSIKQSSLSLISNDNINKLAGLCEQYASEYLEKYKDTIFKSYGVNHSLSCAEYLSQYNKQGGLDDQGGYDGFGFVR
jgi:hypothetical protein